jgi:hypothetical protein
MAKRIVGDGDARRKDTFAELVLKEACLARDCSAADRTREMAEESGRDAGIE